MSGKNALHGYVSLARDLQSGKTTPRDFLEGCLHRIAQLERGIGAFVQINAEGARKAADASTARWKGGKPLSPMHVIHDVRDDLQIAGYQRCPLPLCRVWPSPYRPSRP